MYILKFYKHFLTNYRILKFENKIDYDILLDYNYRLEDKKKKREKMKMFHCTKLVCSLKEKKKSIIWRDNRRVLINAS